MTKKQSPISALPISMEQLARLQTAVDDFSSHQLAWLSGYLWGMVNQNTVTSTPVSAPVPQDETITIISASQTGNARRLSEQLREKLLSEKLNVNLVNAGDYKFKQIAQEKIFGDSCINTRRRRAC
ncbi:Sulfite reductase [NADPH] flavoprotein alpha-component [Providencia stuartii]|nr:Sulfite reductase [NADPH] flavoprotein alpha-component [Providencia stuartii]